MHVAVGNADESGRHAATRETSGASEAFSFHHSPATATPLVQPDIVAQLGLGMGAISQTIYSVVVFMSVATTMVAPPLIKFAEPQAEPDHVRIEIVGTVPPFERS